MRRTLRRPRIYRAGRAGPHRPDTILTTFENFPMETLSDMWRTKSRVLKAIVACDGGNGYAMPRSDTD